jgi:hypothetical protein
MMRRPRVIGVALALLAVCVVACAGGVWATQNSMVTPFVLPGATELDVSGRTLAGLRIVYEAPGQPYAWREAIFQRLVRRGWVSRDYTFGSTRQFTVTWYRRSLDFGPITILESAVVGGDPHNSTLVIIEVHRELHFND